MHNNINEGNTCVILALICSMQQPQLLCIGTISERLMGNHRLIQPSQQVLLVLKARTVKYALLKSGTEHNKDQIYRRLKNHSSRSRCS